MNMSPFPAAGFRSPEIVCLYYYIRKQSLIFSLNLKKFKKIFPLTVARPRQETVGFLPVISLCGRKPGIDQAHI